MTRTARLEQCLIRTMGPINELPTPTAHLMADLYMDSLDVIELVTSVEEEFSISIPDDIAMKWERWGQVMDYVQKLPERIEAASGCEL